MTTKLTTERFILREIKYSDNFDLLELFSDQDTMNLFGSSLIANSIDFNDFIQNSKIEIEKGVLFFWIITSKHDKSFVGFIRLMSYNGDYFNLSFASMGNRRFETEFNDKFDRNNGWEIDYAIIENKRNGGVATECLGAVLSYCELHNIRLVYAKVNSLTNIPSVKVLQKNNFKTHVPLFNKSLLDKYDADHIIANKLYGMTFKWSI
jgi:RimJ/RimL family protein N-acetyltransferase